MSHPLHSARSRRSTLRPALLAAAAALMVIAAACVPEAPPTATTTTTTTSAPPIEPQRPFVLDTGHIDLFELTYDDDTDALELQVKDDTTRYQANTRFRSPEDVTIDVDAARTALELSDDIVNGGYGFLGDAGDTIYLLDEVQSDGIPWPGWSTERLPATLPEGIEIPYEIGAVRFTVQIEGPGDVFTWANGPDGTAINRYIDTTDDAPDIIPTAPSVHAHTAWAFTELGDYHLHVTPEATTTTGQILSGPSYDYHVHVGAPLVDDGDIPELSIAAPTPLPIGATAQLTVTRVPAADGTVYRWYRWGMDGYEDVPGGADGSLQVTVSEAFDLYYATVVGISGREVAGAAVEVVGVNP